MSQQEIDRVAQRCLEVQMAGVFRVRSSRRPRWIGIGLALCGLCLAGPDSRCAPAQILDQLRDDVRRRDWTPDRDDGTDGKSRRREGRGAYDEDSDYAPVELLLAGTLFAVAAVTSPIWGPRSIIGDHSLEPGYFARYPYRNDLPGFMATDMRGVRSYDPRVAEEHYDWLLRARIEYADSFHDLSRIGGQVLWESASRWGIDTQFDRLHEEVPGGPNDNLWLGDANVVFRFAQSPRLQMRTGVGLNWLSDLHGTDVGFNFTYGGDLFVARPWVVSAEIDWGWLGKAGLFRGRTTLGVQLRRWEIYSGYEYLDIGRTQMSSLISGLRLWW